MRMVLEPVLLAILQVVHQQDHFGDFFLVPQKAYKVIGIFVQRPLTRRVRRNDRQAQLTRA